MMAVPLQDRITRNSMPNPLTGCLEWRGRCTHNGYGIIPVYVANRRYRKLRAHRVAYELINGPIPPGLQIDHLCRNRRCVNPEHLECVTREENIRRGNAPHMVNARKTHCKRGHEFTSENTYAGTKGRECVACRQMFNGGGRAARAISRSSRA